MNFWKKIKLYSIKQHIWIPRPKIWTRLIFWTNGKFIKSCISKILMQGPSISRWIRVAFWKILTSKNLGLRFLAKKLPKSCSMAYANLMERGTIWNKKYSKKGLKLWKLLRKIMNKKRPLKNHFTLAQFRISPWSFMKSYRTQCKKILKSPTRFLAIFTQIFTSTSFKKTLFCLKIIIQTKLQFKTKKKLFHWEKNLLSTFFRDLKFWKET